MYVADSFAGARVLVLDDNRTFQSLMRTMLRHLGFRAVDVFSDPREALAHVASVPVDLAFVDLIMPEQNGIDWVGQVRRMVGLANPDMAIVMVSGLAVRRVLEPAIVAGIDGFVVKPLAPETLARHARRALADRHRYVSGPDGYWGPDAARTRLRVADMRLQRRFAALAARLGNVPRAPRLPPGLPGFDVEIARHRPSGEDTLYID